MSTIERSGLLPPRFLKGCGVPDALVRYLPALFSTPVEFYSCFISYSHADREFCHLLYDSLYRSGVRCWLDEKQLIPGQDLYHEIDRGIRLWDKFILCCSRSSLTSWWCDSEIGTALEKEQNLTRQKCSRVQTIIPLDLDGYVFSDEWSSGYRAEIRRRVVADFRDWETDERKFGRELGKVVRALSAQERSGEQPPKQKL